MLLAVKSVVFLRVWTGSDLGVQRCESNSDPVKMETTQYVDGAHLDAVDEGDSFLFSMCAEAAQLEKPRSIGQIGGDVCGSCADQRGRPKLRAHST